MSAIKYSRQRECIREYVKASREHPTAEMVYKAVREKYDKISLGTVYRNLAMLVEQGEIVKLSMGEDWERYDGNVSEHYHCLCRTCGSVTDIHIPSMAHINILAASAFDGKIDGHVAWFFGECGKCQKLTSENE